MTKRSLFIVLPILAGLAAVGCGEKNTVRSSEGKELALTRPANQTMAQGETNKIDISITRKNFSDAVAIDFDDLPSGVSVAETERIPAGDSARTFTLVAKDNATPVQRRVVTVKAKGGGLSVTQTFELTVKAKSS